MQEMWEPKKRTQKVNLSRYSPQLNFAFYESGCRVLTIVAKTFSIVFLGFVATKVNIARSIKRFPYGVVSTTWERKPL